MIALRCKCFRWRAWRVSALHHVFLLLGFFILGEGGGCLARDSVMGVSRLTRNAALIGVIRIDSTDEGGAVTSTQVLWRSISASSTTSRNQIIVSGGPRKLTPLPAWTGDIRARAFRAAAKLV